MDARVGEGEAGKACFLECLSDAGALPSRIDLLKREVVIGRCGATCDVAIKMGLLSRRHARIVLDEESGEWGLVDDESTNGTLVNGVKVQPQKRFELHNGDVISFGAPVQFRFCDPRSSQQEGMSDGEETDVEEFAATTPESWTAQPASQDAGVNISRLSLDSPQPDAVQEDAVKSVTQPVSGRSLSQSSFGFACSRRRKRCRSRTSDHEECPFERLMNLVRHQAKKMCRSGSCKSKETEVIKAATAACDAVRKTKEECSKLNINSAQRHDHHSHAATDGAFVPCMPLLDAEGCVPLVPSNVGTEKHNVTKAAIAVSALANGSDVLSSNGVVQLKNELSCSICQEPFLHASTLECKHTFCEPCINHWLSKNLSCPICRKPVLKPPTGVVAVDKIVEGTFAQANNHSALENLEERRREYRETLERDSIQRTQLERALVDALDQGHKFVHVARPWSEKERCRFLRGVKQYRGLPREAFCSSVSLTESFVMQASLKDLYIAASNVNLGQDEDTWNQMDIIELRNKLIMFIKFG